MSNRMDLFHQSEDPVLSLAVQSRLVARRPQSQFEILVRHLLDRFFHNELLTSDDETKRVMLMSYMIALPSVFIALLLYPAYHPIVLHPQLRPYWAQVGDHYCYVMYSMLIMGAATVYEWDLLFPDLLDIFVLSILPITKRRLFLARALALTIFLLLVLLGTSIFGIVLLPLVASQPNFLRHLLAHAVAVWMSGIFGASTFLALQGALINIVGERMFRRIAPLLQGASIMLLLAVLFLTPLILRSLEPLLRSDSLAIRAFPPFWFLGVYESIFVRQPDSLIFDAFGRIAIYGVVFMIGWALLTYPLAYHRRVRELVEGVSSASGQKSSTRLLNQILHGTLLRLPGQRAVFHFINGTVLRSHRHRVMLAMYGGLGAALAGVSMINFRIAAGHVQITLTSGGVRAAVPIIIFLVVSGSRSILDAPVDRRSVWLFRVLLGRARSSHLEGARIWTTLWAVLLPLLTVIALHTVSPADLQTPLIVSGQMLIAIAVSFILCDIFLFGVHTIPFTHLRKSSVTDFPLMILRNFVIFPLFVTTVVRYERWAEASAIHLLTTLLLFVAAHLLLRKAHAQSLRQFTVDSPPDDADEFPQTLGLRNT